MLSRLILLNLLIFSFSCNSPKVIEEKNKKPTFDADCQFFKLKEQDTGINLSQKRVIDFKMTGVKNKKHRTLEFYTRHPKAIAENITGNIYEPPFSFGGPFPGIDPQYYGCHIKIPYGPDNRHKSCFINIEFNPNFVRHFMSTFILTYYINGKQCAQVITLKGQGVQVY